MVVEERLLLETSETLQELGLVECKVDAFLSDYDDYVDEFGLELDPHGA